MSNSVLIIGQSGAGKSTSGEFLNPTETFWINTIGKDLPFKGWKKKYKSITEDKEKGNYISSFNSSIIINTLVHISKTRPDIKTILIDDYQYILSYEFMNRSKEKGYEKFTDIATNAFNILTASKSLREDITVIILTHSEKDNQGFTKMKTIGKLLDEKITPEGLFTIVLEADVIKDDNDKPKHIFRTITDGNSVVKSPRGMFETETIPNSLQLVIDSIKKYNE